MPQNAVLISNTIGTNGQAIPLRGNNQGEQVVQTAPGNTFYVNESTGSDSNAGNWQHPFATLTAALAACAANNGDKIFLKGTVHITATLVWNKAGVSLIGLDGPSSNPRSRISQTGSTVFSPLVSVTAQDCEFINIGTFHGFNDASTQICWQDSGGRNYYQGCNLLGMGDATAAAQAGSRSLLISGSTGENLFVGCTIGLDTVIRATNANASLEFTGGSPRNIFRNCIFRAFVSDASDVHVKIGADGIDRDVLFDNCTFFNAVDSTGTTMTACISADAASGGSVLVQGGGSVGATHIAASGPVYVTGAVPTAATSSIAVHAA